MLLLEELSSYSSAHEVLPARTATRSRSCRNAFPSVDSLCVSHWARLVCLVCAMPLQAKEHAYKRELVGYSATDTSPELPPVGSEWPPI